MTQTALVEMAEELVERQNVLSTCVSCLLEKREVCQLGFAECPWAAMVLDNVYDGDGSCAAIETDLASKRRSSQLN